MDGCAVQTEPFFAMESLKVNESSGDGLASGCVSFAGPQMDRVVRKGTF